MSRHIKLFQLFVLVTLVCALLSIYSNYRSFSISEQLLGTWYARTEDGMGFRESLKLTSSGRFEKTEEYDRVFHKFEGAFEVANDGLVTFRVDSYSSAIDDSKMLPSNLLIKCRCGIDPSGNLLITLCEYSGEFDFRTYERNCFFRKCYTRLDVNQQDQQSSSELKDLLDKMR